MRLHYRVPLTPDDVVALLTAQVDRPSPLYLVLPGLTTGAPFVGTVTGSGFDIRVRRRKRNSLAPHAFGVIRAAGTDSEIDATVGVGSAIRHALAVFIGLVGVLASPAELSSGAPALLVISIAAVCVAIAVLVWRRGGDDLGFPSSEAQQLHDLLELTFGSHRRAG